MSERKAFEVLAAIGLILVGWLGPSEWAGPAVATAGLCFTLGPAIRSCKQNWWFWPALAIVSTGHTFVVIE